MRVILSRRYGYVDDFEGISIDGGSDVYPALVHQRLFHWRRSFSGRLGVEKVRQLMIPMPLCFRRIDDRLLEMVLRLAT